MQLACASARAADPVELARQTAEQDLQELRPGVSALDELHPVAEAVLHRLDRVGGPAAVDAVDAAVVGVELVDRRRLPGQQPLEILDALAAVADLEPRVGVRGGDRCTCRGGGGREEEQQRREQAYEEEESLHGGAYRRAAAL